MIGEERPMSTVSFMVFDVTACLSTLGIKFLVAVRWKTSKQHGRGSSWSHGMAGQNKSD
jgi:hypothetical protein